MGEYSVDKLIENNRKWAEIRARLAEFPPRFSPNKTIELLDLCRASSDTRYLEPYISLGRLGLWRYDAVERGLADDFLCLYFHLNQYVVSTYDNSHKWFFANPREAIEFVIRNLDKENYYS